jgi:hypothetical protein
MPTAILKLTIPPMTKTTIATKTISAHFLPLSDAIVAALPSSFYGMLPIVKNALLS